MIAFDHNRYERIWVLAKTNFLKRYYGSFLGIVWALINPAVHLMIYYIVFTVVFQSRVPNFALFLFAGLVLLMFFNEATSKGLQFFPSHRYILENIRIDWLDLFLSALLSTFMAFLFNFFVFLAMGLFFKTQISIDVLFFPLILLNHILFCLGVMLILAVIYVNFRDINHIWNLVKMVLLWMSGVFYEIDPATSDQTAILAHLTPLPGIIINTRNVWIYGKGIDWHLFFYDMGYSIVLLIAGWYLMKNFSTRAMERL